MRFRRRVLQIGIPIAFYTAFVVLYVLSFQSVWVHRRLVIDELLTDAGVREYRLLFGCVQTLGITTGLVVLLTSWRGWSWTWMFTAHALLGAGSIAFCGIVWAQMGGTFHPLHTSTWTESGAEAGAGMYLFLASALCLIIGSLSALKTTLFNDPPERDIRIR
jgi:hypothetical protein